MLVLVLSCNDSLTHPLIFIEAKLDNTGLTKLGGRVF